MSEENDPKIIVDDDWKSQVEKEKEELQKKQEETQAAGEMPEIPPASFPMLVSTISSQALAMLGAIPGPDGELQQNLPLAKHFIDTLAVLDEKTKGNLDEDESNLLTETLHQLRMAYLSMANAGPAPGTEPEQKSSIELP